MNFDNMVVEILWPAATKMSFLENTIKVAKIKILKDFNKKTSLKSNLTQQNVF